MGESIRVLLADDDHLVRGGIRLILAPLPDIEVVAEAANGSDAVAMTLQHRPHISLLDIRMPKMDGLAALREMRRVTPGTAVIILTTFGESAYVAEALAGGAAGFVLKDSAVDELERAIRAVYADEAFLSPAITRQVLDRFPATSPTYPTAEKLELLTERERDVVKLVAQGMSNAAISERLWISEGTVKTHVSNIFTKLDCDNRVQVALLAHHAGLLA